MKVQINTDKNIEGSERLESYFSTEITRVLSRFDDKVTRIEVHFGDENSAKPVLATNVVLLKRVQPICNP